MFRRYLPEFIIAILSTVLLLVAYAVKGTSSPPVMRTPNPFSRVQASYLLRLESGNSTLTLENDGSWPGGGLNESELGDLRSALSRLPSQAREEGRFRLVYFSDQGQQVLAYAQRPSARAELEHVLEMLDLYGFQELKKGQGKGRP